MCLCVHVPGCDVKWYKFSVYDWVCKTGHVSLH